MQADPAGLSNPSFYRLASYTTLLGFSQKQQEKNWFCNAGSSCSACQQTDFGSIIRREKSDSKKPWIASNFCKPAISVLIRFRPTPFGKREGTERRNMVLECRQRLHITTIRIADWLTVLIVPILSDSVVIVSWLEMGWLAKQVKAVFAKLHKVVFYFAKSWNITRHLYRVTKPLFAFF